MWRGIGAVECLLMTETLMVARPRRLLAVVTIISTRRSPKTPREEEFRKCSVMGKS